MPSLDPTRTALLLMDYQPGIIANLPEAEALVARAGEALGAARRAGATVVYVRVGFTASDLAEMPETSGMAARARARGDALSADSPETQIDERLAPAAKDIIVRKVRVGSFSTTDLDIQLRERGLDTLVLAGLSTSGVVLSTVRDGFDRDYRLLVLSDACGDPEPETHTFLVERVLSRQAQVMTVEEFVADLEG